MRVFDLWPFFSDISFNYNLLRCQNRSDSELLCEYGEQNNAIRNGYAALNKEK
jgi:hypothetical protein